jgi:hypothetical protein
VQALCAGAVAVILAVRSPHATGAEGNKARAERGRERGARHAPLPSSAEPSAVGSALPASSVRVGFRERAARLQCWWEASAFESAKKGSCSRKAPNE